MNTEILITTIRLICGTGLLYLIYVSLLKKRINGNLSRAFLLIGTTLFSILAFISINDEINTEGENLYLITLPEITAEKNVINSIPSIQINWLIMAYIIPLSMLLIIFIINMIKLLRIGKTGHTTVQSTISVTESSNVRFPFSFGSHIYLPNGMDAKSRSLVIEHEMVHIKHYHTVDIIFFEFLKMFGWFNPFYYLLEKELRQAHEFTADGIVLQNGTSSEQYCEALLSCALAGMKVPVNYFNGSQIKTRIYMMNKKKNLRQAVMVFIAATLVVGGISATSPNFIGVKQQPTAVVSQPDKMPEYPGGNEAMIKFIVANLTYPTEAKNAKVEGKVFISFVINEKGYVVDVKIVRGIGHGCDEEALRTVKLMPNWTPGEKDGKPVSVAMNLPIQFKLQ